MRYLSILSSLSHSLSLSRPCFLSIYGLPAGRWRTDGGIKSKSTPNAVSGQKKWYTASSRTCVLLRNGIFPLSRVSPPSVKVEASSRRVGWRRMVAVAPVRPESPSTRRDLSESRTCGGKKYRSESTSVGHLNAGKFRVSLVSPRVFK